MNAESYADQTYHGVIESFVADLDMDTSQVGVGLDSQNGDSGDSIWFEAIGAPSLRETLEACGFDTFVAPKDDGKMLYSTYGIPVTDLATLQEGDHVRIREFNFALVVDTTEFSDGGPWTKKTGRFTAVTVRGGRNDESTFLLIQRPEGGEIRAYSVSSRAPSGWASYQHFADQLYRAPRPSDAPEVTG